MPHKRGLEKVIKEHLPYEQKNLRGIEIGCFEGELSAHLLTEFQGLYLVTIDPSPQWDDVIERNKAHFSRLWILNQPSDVAHKILLPEYDFVFIDGDHSYEQCKKDIINYERLVIPGGIVSGHNYHKANDSAHPGVHQSVDEIYPDVKLEHDFIWYVQKPK